MTTYTPHRRGNTKTRCRRHICRAGAFESGFGIGARMGAQTRKSAPDAAGWWYYWAGDRWRILEVVEHKGILMLAVHAGCLFSAYPGLWQGPIRLPEPPEGI
jgi:hypothetical protein